MNWLALETVAQISVERIINALPEGLVVAFFAWVLLRVLRRQNSGTRFAVWFLALLTIAALPVLGSFNPRQTTPAGMSWGSLRPAITVPGSWALFLFLAWAIGASAAMARLAFGLWRLRQLRRSCTAIDAADLDPAMRKTLDTIDSSRSITITTSEQVRVPAAIGFWKRTVVLPAWTLRELPPDDLNIILLHELAHLRRGDDWTNLIQKVVRALFFFHPAVWWIENRVSMEREMACDDAVLAATANPHGYASCLVSLLEKSLAHRLSHERWSMAHAAVRRAREASLRLAQILDTNRPVATRVWKPALGMVGTFAVVCLMALPHSPQLVAFDQGSAVSNSNHGYSAGYSPAVSSSGLQTAAVIPVALRTRDSVSAKVKVARPHAVAGHRLTPPQMIAARLNSAPPPNRVVATRASADQEMAPQSRTLVFIEATEYMTSPDSAVWSVHVWRVTLVRAVRDRVARVPVANSI
jgi:beta-lactamase regulating signal transducer with metallopeptidase domain